MPLKTALAAQFRAQTLKIGPLRELEILGQ